MEKRNNNELLESPEIKFHFITENERLIIVAFIEEEKIRYVGEMLFNPYIDFDLIKEMVEEKQFNILNQNENTLKIKIGPVIIELIVKPKTEADELKEEIEKLTQQKNEIETQIEKLTKRCNELENNINEDQQLEKVQSFKWSQALKSEKNIVNGSITTKKGTSFFNEFTLTEIGFSKKMNKKQSWAIKCLMDSKKERLGFFIGICLKKGLESKKFVSDLYEEREIGHNEYLIGSNGQTFSGLCESLNNKKMNFKYSEGDTIYVEYDPINWCLRFRLNKKGERFEMPIIPPPEDDEYHPCVALHWSGLSAELIWPGESLSI